MPAWTFNDIPDQTGRTAIVTGANTGIGFETARMLALKGADVVLACRSLDKGRAAVERIQNEKPAGRVSVEALDLSDLDAVAAFAGTFAAKHPRLDLLINNAGVMVPPFGRTKQGFELQVGVNHLGHFALTARLLPLLEKTAGSRVVVVASSAHKFGKIDLDDLNWERRKYNAWRAYGQSKLANLLFMRELSRRVGATGSQVRVTGAHPGYSATDLQRTSLARYFNRLIAMSPVGGALPTLRAAVDPAAESGSYWGPSGPFELHGPPGRAGVSAGGRDAETGAKLFALSERLTGVAFPKVADTTLRAAG